MNIRRNNNCDEYAQYSASWIPQDIEQELDVDPLKQMSYHHTMDSNTHLVCTILAY